MPGVPITSGPGRTARAAPPKPVVTPWVSLPNLPQPPLTTIPPEPLAAWRGLWHAIGSNLPFYVNQSRATRRALRSFMVTHG